MIDTHTHLNFPKLESDLEAVLQRAKEAGVQKFIIPATDAASSVSGVILAGERDDVFAAAGIHPTDAHLLKDGDFEQLEELVEGTRKVVAIGEVGLDYYHLEDCKTDEEKEERKRTQQLMFIDMITMAKDYHLPLIIHTRDAFEDTLQILEEQAPNHPVVIHCFTGTQEQATAFLNYGAFLSFTGIITYKKNDALREVVKNTPIERIMIETDSPFLAPQGYRGQVCEPRFTREVAACIAEIKGISIEEVDEISTETAESFFGI